MNRGRAFRRAGRMTDRRASRNPNRVKPSGRGGNGVLPRFVSPEGHGSSDPRRSAAAATADGQTATFYGPFVQQPKISTGAGDHFNAGFCLGRVLGFGLEESLCTGVATSGYYVRHAESPSAELLAGFIAELPPPQA